MNRIILVIALLCGLTAFAHPAEMKEFTFKDELMGFSIPGEPHVTPESVDSPQGKVTGNNYWFMKEGKGFLMVMVLNFPVEILKTDPYKLLQAERDFVLKNGGHELLSEKRIEIDSNPGIEFKVSDGTKQLMVHGTYRIFLVGTRLYMLSSCSRKGLPLLDVTDDFFASFHLIKS